MSCRRTISMPAEDEDSVDGLGNRSAGQQTRESYSIVVHAAGALLGVYFHCDIVDEGEDEDARLRKLRRRHEAFITSRSRLTPRTPFTGALSVRGIMRSSRVKLLSERAGICNSFQCPWSGDAKSLAACIAKYLACITANQNMR